MEQQNDEDAEKQAPEDKADKARKDRPVPRRPNRSAAFMNASRRNAQSSPRLPAYPRTDRGPLTDVELVAGLLRGGL